MGDRKPFQLSIRVIAASNLPVADLTTSDPYVALWIGEREIGRTTTIYKNHLHPEWNQTVVTHLLHDQAVCQLRIFDEDFASDPDLLGTVDINLHKLPKGKTIRKTYPVVVSKKYKSPATLELELSLTRCLLISLLSQPVKQIAKLKSVHSMSYEPVNEIQSGPVWVDVPELVQQTFLDFAVEGLSHYSSSEIMADLLHDASRLLSKHPSPSVLGPCIHRNGCQMVNGVKVWFRDESLSQRHMPIEPHSLQINLGPSEGKFIVVKLPDRLTMWIWVKWLRKAYGIWTDGIAKSAWPTWTEASPLVCMGGIRSYDGQNRDEKVSLDLDMPFRLICGSQAFSLRGMTSMVIAADTWMPKAYALEVGLSILSPEAGQPVAAAKGQLGGQLMNMLSAVKGSGASHTFATVHCDTACHTFPNGNMLVDFHMAEIKGSRYGVMDEEDGGQGSLPAKLPTALAMDIFLVSGTDGKERIIGQKTIKAHQLMSRDGKPGSWKEMELCLDSALAFEVKIGKASRLLLPSSDLMSLRAANMTAKCKLVDATGKSISGAKKSHAVKVSASADFASTVLFDSSDRLDKAAYIRIELMIEKLTPQCIGGVYIPLEYFALKEETMTFPLTRLSMPITDWLAASQVADLGELEVTIRKREETLPVGPKVLLKAMVHESNLVNNLWFAEALLVKDFLDHDSTPEHANLAIFVEGLMLQPETVELPPIAIVPPKPGKGPGPPPMHWRQRLFLATPHAVLGCCRERAEKDVLIPWSQIVAVQVITPCLLSVLCKVDRYLPTPGQPDYRTVQVELFISNCPAKELSAFIQERKMFYGLHVDIQDLVQCGTIFGSEAIATESQGPVEQAKGSRILDDLNYQIKGLSAGIAHCDALLSSSHDDEEPVTKEKTILQRRLCRCRLYKACLLAAQLTGEYSFDVDDVRELVESDLYRVYRFEGDELMSTAAMRIECLLDMAKQRIQDAVLCGWKHKAHPKDEQNLIRCLEIIANGYYTEMINIVSAIFNNTTENEVRGLANKLQLLKTYMRHDDSMDRILSEALAVYSLTPAVPACLSPFVSFTILSHWYSAELTEEMKHRVDDVVAVWRDPGRNSSDNLQKYRHVLPWVPEQLAPGIFYTNLPEDLADYLLTYLQAARICGKDVALSFQKEMEVLDRRVIVAYINAFFFLAEQYQRALNEKDFIALVGEEFDEYTTFLFSVINDMKRVQEESDRGDGTSSGNGGGIGGDGIGLQALVASKDRALMGSADISEILKKTMRAFKDVSVLALDQLSCMLCIYSLDAAQRIALLSPQLVPTWLAVAELNPNMPMDLFRDVVRKLKKGLEDSKDFMTADGWMTLKMICASKIVMILLVVVREAALAGNLLDNYPQQHVFVLSVCQEAQWAKDELTAWVGDSQRAIGPLHFLEHLPVLLGEEDSSAIVQALVAIERDLHASSMAERTAYVQAIHACFTVRGLQLNGEQAAQRESISETKKEKRGSLPFFGFIQAAGEKVHQVGQKAGQKVKEAGQKVGNVASNVASNVVNIRRGSAPSMATGHGHGGLGGEMDDEARKESAMMASLNLCLESILRVSGHSNSQQLTSQVLFRATSPVLRVFEADAGNLETLLLCSAAVVQSNSNSPKAGKLQIVVQGLTLLVGKDKEEDGGAKFGGSMLGNIMSAIRLPIGKEEGSVRSMRFSSMDSSPDGGSSFKPGDVPDRYLHLRDFQASNLFYLDAIHPPRPYFLVKLANAKERTSGKPVGNSADWTNDKPIMLPIYSTTATASSMDLKVMLYYEGFRFDHLVGTVRIPIDPNAPQAFEHKSFVFSEFGKEALRAAKKAEKEGRGMPTVTFSLMPSM